MIYCPLATLSKKHLLITNKQAQNDDQVLKTHPIEWPNQQASQCSNLKQTPRNNFLQPTLPLKRTNTESSLSALTCYIILNTQNHTYNFSIKNLIETLINKRLIVNPIKYFIKISFTKKYATKYLSPIMLEISNILIE